MAELDIVDEEDKVIGKADFEEIHKKGLRHRSVQIFVFDKPNLENLLIAQRSSKQETSKLKLHPSAGGHVKLGQSYLRSAQEELKEELFYEYRELPTGVTLVEIARYKNDSRPTNKENTCLFFSIYSGPFSIDEAEIKRIYWENINNTWENMRRNQDDYTFTFLNAMKEFRRFRGLLK